MHRRPKWAGGTVMMRNRSFAANRALPLMLAIFATALDSRAASATRLDLVSQWPSDHHILDIVAIGNYVLATHNTDGLLTLDYSDPANPQQVHSVPLEGEHVYPFL